MGLVTFLKGGALVTSDSHLQSTGHGTWMKLGDNRFAFTFKKFWYVPPGTLMGIITIREVIELGDGGTTYEGLGEFEIVDLDGNVVAESYCDETRGTRMKVELPKPECVEVEMPDDEDDEHEDGDEDD
jgi:hypothetical protein